MAPAEVPSGNETGAPLGCVRVGRDGIRAVVWLWGEHDLATKGAVRAALADAVAADADVVVDLTDASFLDASVLGVMVHSSRFLADRDRRLTIRGAQGAPLRVIEVCGLGGLIEGSLAAAPAEGVAPSALETWVEVPRAGSSGQSRRPPDRVAAGNDSDCHAR